MNPTKSVRPRLSSRVRGLFTKAIPYEIRNTTGDWSPYFGTYEGQKHLDIDTNSCWAFAGGEILEDQLEFLWKTGQFGKEAMAFFTLNGYIDSDGDFYLSRRFIPILSGVKNNGNDESEFWRLTELHGAIPNWMLPFTNNLEYFDRSKITDKISTLGKEFLTHVNVAHQGVGRTYVRKNTKLIQDALFQGELQIGIPVPAYGWNQVKVDWDGQTQAAHSVALYKYDEKADSEHPYFIYDQYEPHLKQLSKDYFITICTAGVVTANNPSISNPVSQETLGARIWRAIAEFFSRFPAFQ